MKKFKLLMLIVIISITGQKYSISEEMRMGIEGGLVYADMRAEDTAQALANASGSTVTYSYDEATWVGRFFADMPLTSEMSVELGFFLTGSLDATYTISGASATEAYDARGVDAAAVFNSDNIFFKVGMHRSELNGLGSITIGGTKYTVSETISGTGYLVGGGVELDDSRVGLTYYSDVGGDGDSDMTMVYYGVMF